MYGHKHTFLVSVSRAHSIKRSCISKFKKIHIHLHIYGHKHTFLALASRAHSIKKSRRYLTICLFCVYMCVWMRDGKRERERERERDMTCV